jgi:hypothetical protein
LSNLNLRADEYKGIDQIKVGNGQGLDILHIGLAQIPSSSKFFSLPNLLHVPQIDKKKKKKKKKKKILFQLISLLMIIKFS